jgi:hypothetical protein
MQSVEFTMEESELLRELLQHKIEEADVELFHTDTRDYKQMLKHRRGVLEHLLTKLSNVSAQVSHGG